MNSGLYFFGLALALGIGLPIGVIGAGIGQGLAASGALQGMARQPEMAGTIRASMIIALAFIESLVIYSLVIFLLMQGKLPDTQKMMDAGTHAAIQQTAPDGHMNAALPRQ